MSNVVNLNDRAKKRSTKKSKVFFPKSEFLRCYTKLGLTIQEAMLVLHHVDRWWKEERLPFPSDRTVAEEMGLSIRTVKRMKRSLQDKGFLRTIDRFEHNRQTSSRLDYTPLVEAVLRGSRDVKNDTLPMTPVSPSPMTPVSYWNRSIHTYVCTDLEKEETQITINRIKTPSALGGDRSKGKPGRATERPNRAAELAGRLLSEQESPGSTLFSFTPLAVALGKGATMSIDGAKKAMEAAIAKNKKQRDKNTKKKERREAQFKKQVEAAPDARRVKQVQAKYIAGMWRDLFMEHHPDRADRDLPTRFNRSHYAQFGQLFEAWGVDETKELVEFVMERWSLVEKLFKNCPPAPHPGFVLVTQDRMMGIMRAVRDHTAIMKEIDERELSEYAPLPRDLQDRLSEVLKELKRLRIDRELLQQGRSPVEPKKEDSEDFKW